MKKIVIVDTMIGSEGISALHKILGSEVALSTDEQAWAAIVLAEGCGVAHHVFELNDGVEIDAFDKALMALDHYIQAFRACNLSIEDSVVKALGMLPPPSSLKETVGVATAAALTQRARLSGSPTIVLDQERVDLAKRRLFRAHATCSTDEMAKLFESRVLKSTLETFIDLMSELREVYAMAIQVGHVKGHSCLASAFAERYSIKELQDLSDIIARNQDKLNGAMVILFSEAIQHIYSNAA